MKKNDEFFVIAKEDNKIKNLEFVQVWNKPDQLALVHVSSPFPLCLAWKEEDHHVITIDYHQFDLA